MKCVIVEVSGWNLLPVPVFHFLHFEEILLHDNFEYVPHSICWVLQSPRSLGSSLPITISFSFITFLNDHLLIFLITVFFFTCIHGTKYTGSFFSVLSFLFDF